jgi:Ca2+/H+ antiporter, TMEM165/GDT1 family
MDLKLLFTTFGMVFLAELGDKTQLAAFCLSANCDSKLTVFVGSAGALVVASALAVICGSYIGRFVSPQHIKIGAGLFFILVGLWTLFTPASSACSL